MTAATKLNRNIHIPRDTLLLSKKEHHAPEISATNNTTAWQKDCSGGETATEGAKVENKVEEEENKF